MDFRLAGKSVIVTAASRGLGKAIATEYAREGAHVMLSSRSEEALRETVNAIKQGTGNPNIDYTLCDMKNAEQIKQLIHKTLNWNGTVDVLINNAGGPPAGSFMDMNDDDWYHAFELNLLSFIRTIRAVVPIMKEQKSGHIVNLASSSIKESIHQLVLSNTMRPGIVGLAKTLSQELGVHNILINTVGPGTIETKRITELNTFRANNQGLSAGEIKHQAENSIPMKRYGNPEEFAKAVVFLGSGANTYITGQSLIVDGGKMRSL